MGPGLIRDFDRIGVGDRRVSSKVVTDRDIEMFAALTGDFNPVHLQEDSAQRTLFKGRIAHGMLTAGLISAALSKFPGIAVYLSQSLSFLRPVRPGDTIEATAEVVEKISGRDEIRMETHCTNQMGERVISGEARIKLLDSGAAPDMASGSDGEGKEQ